MTSKADVFFFFTVFHCFCQVSHRFALNERFAGSNRQIIIPHFDSESLSRGQTLFLDCRSRGVNSFLGSTLTLWSQYGKPEKINMHGPPKTCLLPFKDLTNQ